MKHLLIFGKLARAEEVRQSLIGLAFLKISRSRIQPAQPEQGRGYVLTFSTEQELMKKTQDMIIGGFMPTKAEFNLPGDD